MAVKIRFARVGKRHAPVYRIVAIDSRKKRDGRFLENLGTYNPLTKQLVQFHSDRVQHWISVGAIVTDAVQRLIKLHAKESGVALKKTTTKPKAEKKVKNTAEKKTVAKPKATETKTAAKKTTTKTTTKKKAE